MVKYTKSNKLVKVNYKNKTKRIPSRYLANLKGKERTMQIKSILEKKKRPKTSFKSKKSSWTKKFNDVYGEEIEKMKNKRSLKNIAKVSQVPYNALLDVFNKGKAAYYNGGSRPNQTPESWA